MKMFSLQGKNAIVIGGSKGIGKSMAKGLASAGATVIICSRNQKDLDVAANEISKITDARVVGIAADMSSIEAVKTLVNRVILEFGHIDVLVNAAGVNVRKAALDFDESDWDLVQNVQLKYVFFMCQAVARHMVKEGIKGKIINIASLTSLFGFKNMISYCSAKGAIVQMTKAYANELAPYGICVNAMAPGYTKTEMTSPLFENPEWVKTTLSRIPINRTGVPDDYMGVAVFLASSASDYMTGQLVIVDGGWAAS